MGIENWLRDNADSLACCPDPDADGFDPELHRFEDDGGYPRLDDEAMTAHGYDSRTTPVDTLMGGPIGMGLQYAFDMEFGDYA